jgi:iron complex transport system substrate-binding protein
MKLTTLVLCCVMALATVACTDDPSSGGDGGTTTVADTTDTAAFPVTVGAPNGPVTIDRQPQRIVSISPTSTEVLYAIGAGPQVTAVDSLSNHPDGAPVTDLSAFTPNVEAIAAFEPDLVILSYDPADIVAGLEAIGIPVILHPTADGLDDAFSQWEQIGAATGHLAEATELVMQVGADIADAFGSLPSTSSDLSYYYELEPTLYSATSTTFIGELFSGTRMTNIADDQDADGFGYPQLSAEYVVSSDPDIIILADTKCCGQSAATVAERPGWDTMRAVADGTIVELDDDIASRWGPRIVDLVDVVVAEILEMASVDA